MSAFHDKIDQAIQVVEKRKGERDKCPVCNRLLALLTLSFRAQRIALLCRFCNFQAFTSGTPRKKPKKEKPGKVVQMEKKAS